MDKYFAFTSVSFEKEYAVLAVGISFDKFATSKPANEVEFATELEWHFNYQSLQWELVKMAMAIDPMCFPRYIELLDWLNSHKYPDVRDNIIDLSYILMVVIQINNQYSYTESNNTLYDLVCGIEETARDRMYKISEWYHV